MSKRIGIDFDGTIVPFGPLTDFDQSPYPNVPEAIQGLRDKGYYIVILTSRLSPTWWKHDWERFGAKDEKSFGEAQVKYIIDYLDKWKIPYDIATAEKIPCDIYFDDKYITVSEDYPLDVAIEEHLG